ncbi:MAG: hypothetical protein MI924_14280 [Chloroflexales bacterium]|nr:hypothetical protein [Chloroflexales bacterium]
MIKKRDIKLRRVPVWLEVWALFMLALSGLSACGGETLTTPSADKVTGPALLLFYTDP